MVAEGRSLSMSIRVMNLEDLEIVLAWAADEGWNPGLNDAQAFYKADPEGFFVKEVDGAPVAAISVVNHDPNFAFLGLYLCRPEYRGQGHGLEIWQAGIAHADTRSIGLDGVPEQQGNYARSGFVKYGSSVRYEGNFDVNPDPRVRAARAQDMPKLVELDGFSCGIERERFAQAWFSRVSDRQTMVLREGADITGFATFRRCRAGSKIGPLYAGSESDAWALLASNPYSSPDKPDFIDVQDQNGALAELLRGSGFEPVFETARMFRGAPPVTQPARFQAIATMELG